MLTGDLQLPDDRMIHNLRMTHMMIAAALSAGLALTGCGKTEEDIDPAPVAQLQGPWHMVNRATSCETSYTVISPNGVFRLYEGGARKKYLTIRKFTLEPGKVTLLSTGIDKDPEKEISLTFSLLNNKLRLLDITGASGESFKEPPKSIEPEQQIYMKTLFRVQEMRFAMDKCTA